MGSGLIGNGEMRVGEWGRGGCHIYMDTYIYRNIHTRICGEPSRGEPAVRTGGRVCHTTETSGVAVASRVTAVEVKVVRSLERAGTMERWNAGTSASASARSSVCFSPSLATPHAAHPTHI